MTQTNTIQKKQISKTIAAYFPVWWQNEFYKGNGWADGFHFPSQVCVNKEHIKNNGLDPADFVKVKISIEEINANK